MKELDPIDPIDDVNPATKILAKHTGLGFSLGKTADGPLTNRFTAPPFSVWDTKQEYWIKRRRQWLSLGIESEEGRDDRLAYKIPDTMPDGSVGKRTKSGTSVFDPVVVELVNSWWCKPGGVIVDPYAGGSVRGLVASMLGFKYWGSELRAIQVDSNKRQRDSLKDAIKDAGGYLPKWVCGDSADTLDKAPKADMIFSCPPYGNLETYSDDPKDISSFAYEDFVAAHHNIIAKACDRLRENRFACFVVANYRDKDGGDMRDLVADTTAGFAAAGLKLYNEGILVNSIGTCAMRTNTSFVRGARKLVKMHQNILVYVKGDPREAAKSIPVIYHRDKNKNKNKD